MSFQTEPFIVTSPDPTGSHRWVVSMASTDRFQWFLFDTRRQARRAAHALAIQSVQNGQDFAVWLGGLPHTLRTNAVEATIDLADALFADAMARKERHDG